MFSLPKLEETVTSLAYHFGGAYLPRGARYSLALVCLAAATGEPDGQAATEDQLEEALAFAKGFSDFASKSFSQGVGFKAGAWHIGPAYGADVTTIHAVRLH